MLVMTMVVMTAVFGQLTGFGVFSSCGAVGGAEVAMSSAAGAGVILIYIHSIISFTIIRYLYNTTQL